MVPATVMLAETTNSYAFVKTTAQGVPEETDATVSVTQLALGWCAPFSPPGGAR